MVVVSAIIAGATALAGAATAAGVTAAGLGAAAGVAGLGASAYGTYEQSQAAGAAARISAEQEGLRQRQMNLESQRKQRDMIRQAQAARAGALSAATQGGTAAEGGSLLPGVYGQVEGQLGRGTSALTENTSIGNSIFANNARLAQVQGDQATAAGITDFGKTLFSASQSGAIGRIGQQFGSSGAVADVGQFPWTSVVERA